MVVSMFTNLNYTVPEFHSHLSDSKLKMPLQLQLIYIYYCIGCLRKINDQRWKKCEIMQMDAQSSIGVP